MFLILVFRVFGIFTVVAFAHSCGPSEYRSAGGECCPMCNIGSVVFHDCLGDFSTTCKPCSQGTFMSEPNGLYKCFPCKNCDQSHGLYTQSKCTTMTNSICDVLDGYYCIEYHNSECIYTLKHSVCKPGQGTKLGTKRSDTVCVDCGHGFYSPSGLNCTKWTDCATRNEIQTADGSFIKDVTCAQKRGRYGLIAAVLAAVLAAVPSVLSLFRYSSSEVLNTGPALKFPVEETRSTITHGGNIEGE
ncbi:tumor necrosis factor receptor superfamily member 14-like [Xyrauchen texanus]|uniref:tumor necrosis factor receptor superfamily member 14-like n=1 Tax=Xyrauchen texanus TaxID=154827 RepID=UPI0022427D46|nr:tumor necrosis factor receptor superfamily member 14-like [Xyrauchen texanus]